MSPALIAVLAAVVVGFLLLAILPLVLMSKLKAGRQKAWAPVVERLGGRELEARGIMGTKSYQVGAATLSVVVQPVVDANVAGELGKVDNDYKTQVVVPVHRPIEPFLVMRCPPGFDNPYGSSDFEKSWMIVPFGGGLSNQPASEPSDARESNLAASRQLIDEEVRRLLLSLSESKKAPYVKIYSGGQTVVGVADQIATDEVHVQALLSACRRLAGESV